MDRRSFIKLTAVTGTTASLAACGNPEHQLIRFVPDDDIVPEIATFKPSVCPLCRAGCGLTVRVMDADVDTVRNGQAGVVRMSVAKKLDGNPAHPISRGRICVRGQAAIQVTYHPDRITQPLRRIGNRGEGRYEAVSWDDAIKDLVSRLDAAAATPTAVTFVSRPGASYRAALIDQFLAGYGTSRPVTFELFGDDVLRRANALSFGREQLPTFDLAHAMLVVSFGSDFLGTWNSPVFQSAAFGDMRGGRAGIRGSFVQAESRMSQTGASADEWVAIRPGTEGVLALGLAHVIMAANLRPVSAGGRAGAQIAGWSAGLADYTPDKVQEITGVAPRRLEELARTFAERRPAVALISGPGLAHTNGLFNALAVNALNALVGSVEQPGGVFFTPRLPGVAATGRTAPALDKLASDILAAPQSPVQVLLVDEANPVFDSPPAWRVHEAFQKIPSIVSFGSFLTETSVLADLILPDHSFLESYVDVLPESGSLTAVASVAPPVMRPLYQTRSMVDVLLDVGRRLARPVALPWQTYDEMLKASFATLPAAAGGDAWTAAQAQGGWWGAAPGGAPPAAAPGAATSPMTYTAAQFAGDPQQFPFYFLPYPSMAFLDGSLAHLPWLQELPDPLTSAMWSSWVEINPATAARLGIRQGDVVEISSPQGKLQTAAMISPGIAPDMLAMPAGQGHRTFTRYASDRGANPVALLAPMTDAATGALAWAATRVAIARIGDGDGRLVMFAGEMREHTPQQELGRG